ncbi:MAG: SHOCT domain-containing protein [Candidatus Bathyarchaeota archaeon]|nr:MAG: SHOCT domain-containing protein [Candidatus Bathyarchaeota archaeon]
MWVELHGSDSYCVSGAIAVGVYYLVTGSIKRDKSTLNRGGRALEILKERYARGEITKDQFLTMRKELE